MSFPEKENSQKILEINLHYGPWKHRIFSGKYQLRGHQLCPVYALVSGNPRTPIPGECGALAGDFSGFGLSLFPRYAGFSTALGASIGERGP